MRIIRASYHNFKVPLPHLNRCRLPSVQISSSDFPNQRADSQKRDIHSTNSSTKKFIGKRHEREESRSDWRRREDLRSIIDQIKPHEFGGASFVSNPQFPSKRPREGGRSTERIPTNGKCFLDRVTEYEQRNGKYQSEVQRSYGNHLERGATRDVLSTFSGPYRS
jgi:hypothetical protein